MSNFDFLKSDPAFAPFRKAAMAAEQILHIDPAICAVSCRTAMESAVKWMYSVDYDLKLPFDKKLNTLMKTEEFRAIVPYDVWKRMDYIRLAGNDGTHGKSVTLPQAELCLENLFIFLDFVACCYADSYEAKTFDRELLKPKAEAPAPVSVPAVDLEALIAENQALKEQLTARREEQKPAYVPKPLEITEYETRKLYIDSMLRDAGWTEGKDWINEVELYGMPNKSKTGYADYVLFDDAHRPLAVIEAKRTCVDVATGRQQAKLYADLLEKQYGRRPIIFLTNGFDTRIWNDVHDPERPVAAMYSKRDLEKLLNLQSMRRSLATVSVNQTIAGRYYQEAAIKAVCDTFDRKNRRKALLVMATGSGKTRTIIGLCDVLLRHGWVKNILFLADRNSLVTQAKRSFVNLLPDLSVTNLCEEKDNVHAHCVFSTYQTMMGCIDSIRDEEGKLFTIGHFDLVICDEAHRSIYNKYQEIFHYFDAPLVGLTATPKDEIDKNTYQIFELENGNLTYGYELAQAVQDGYLVDYLSVEAKLKFIEQGIVYDELSEEDKENYENTFKDENGELVDHIASSALNEWVFNEDTIRRVLDILMTQGLRIQYGEKLGKTIIFAKNHRHAEEILRIFGKEYSNLPGYAKVIDNHTKYAQSAIDEFSEPNKLPQIAISVDMLDTGIDVPEVLNLVFFKKVMSKAKFWQMIGRGTRLCPGLLDGKDKEKFYIFDFCGNFEFFRMNKGHETPNVLALQGAIFHLKAEIAYKLQDIVYQTEELVTFRKSLVKDMAQKVQELNRENFAVRQHLRYVEKFSDKANYQTLSYEDTLMMREELAPLIQPDQDEASAVRFDALMYGIELAYLIGKKYKRARNDLVKRVTAVSQVANIPEIIQQSALIERILHTDYLDTAGINEFEHIREKLRSLMKYIRHDPQAEYQTNYEDDLLQIDWKEAELDTNDLQNYRAKAEYYIRQHPENEAIQKLRTNVPLCAEDVKQLEQILWSEVGSQKEYESEYGTKPLGEFVREIIGMDMNAAKEAFAEYLHEANLDSRQIYFVNQIIEYIVHNGMMTDLSVLQDPPFTDQGSIVEVFTDLSVWMGIRSVIDRINANACST